jgi:hypothetical protein
VGGKGSHGAALIDLRFACTRIQSILSHDGEDSGLLSSKSTITIMFLSLLDEDAVPRLSTRELEKSWRVN